MFSTHMRRPAVGSLRTATGMAVNTHKHAPSYDRILPNIHTTSCDLAQEFDFDFLYTPHLPSSSGAFANHTRGLGCQNLRCS